MAVSAFRAAVCAGALVGCLMLGDSAAGPADADPGSRRDGHDDRQSSKGVNSARHGRGHANLRNVGERLKPTPSEKPAPPPTMSGSARESADAATESGIATFSDLPEAEPELVPDPDREANPDGAEPGVGTEGAEPGADADPGPPAEPGADGSDYSDTIGDTTNADMSATAVVSTPEQPVQKLDPDIEYAFPYYLLLQIRRDGGDWWNANQVISRLGEAISAYLRAPPAPVPEPVPAPAFRGPAPEAPAPEPVLDVSGGVAGGGSDYQATGFGGAPVLRAAIIAMPAPVAGVVRFPSVPPAVAPGAGLTAARGTGVETASASSGVRSGPEQLPNGTVTSISGQTPRQGYTNYLRSAGLPQLAGAALPGVAGILLLTLGGGVIGHRQASAGRMVRMTGAARYLP